ncbi:MAG: hypothetical protein ABL982_14560, partial [Vicinamibacterales bacterium]
APKVTAPVEETPPPPVVIPRPSTPESELAAELGAIDTVLRAVEATKWPEGRTALDAYRSTWPRGQLGLEATALEVLILCGEQRTGEARALAAELQRRAPLNPSVQRLGSSCAARGSP